MNTIQTTALVQLQNPAGLSSPQEKSKPGTQKPVSGYDRVDLSKVSSEQNDKKRELELIQEAIHVLPDKRSNLLEQVRENLNNGTYFQEGFSEKLAGKLIDIVA